MAVSLSAGPRLEGAAPNSAFEIADLARVVQGRGMGRARRCLRVGLGGQGGSSMHAMGYGARHWMRQGCCLAHISIQLAALDVLSIRRCSQRAEWPSLRRSHGLSPRCRAAVPARLRQGAGQRHADRGGDGACDLVAQRADQGHGKGAEGDQRGPRVKVRFSRRGRAGSSPAFAAILGSC